ncbi:MAG: LytTR family transcriptional regulator [Bacillus subtilis]|nr:LytTR family transcriptional regulator [Bacillus subtilis]
MKLKLTQDSTTTELTVEVRYAEDNEALQSLVRSLRLFDETITGRLRGESHFIPIRTIYYFESVEDKVFCYTEKEVYETNYRLYELEEVLPKGEFVRTAKSAIVHLRKIKSFRSGLSGRIEATMKNGEVLLIARSFVKAVKEELYRLGGVSHENR